MASARKRKRMPSDTSYQVFLSFRRLGTPKVFVEALDHALSDAGIRVFRRRERLSGGSSVGDKISREIDESRILVPVFSRTYASSRRCLAELSQMFKSMEASSGKSILPVFYDVKVDDVKLRSDLYREALWRHKSRFPHETVKEWKDALRRAGKIEGFSLNDRRRGEFVRLLVEEISKKLKSKVNGEFVTELLVQGDYRVVGMKAQVKKLEQVLAIESQDVLFVGIHGIGGIGKTTLARVIFDQLGTDFEGSSFLRDVRETSKHHGLKSLLDQLLRDVTHAHANCETKATHIFLEKKVLIILDDVDDREQIEKLVGKSNQFAPGSRIIVTTRDIDVLAVEHETQNGRILEWPERVRSFEMKEMESIEALQLFCHHAFGQRHPPNGYLRPCEEVISVIGKLPLVLETLGSLVNQKSENIRKLTLEKLTKLPDQGLKKKLMISYDALDRETKEIFLDIACFFTGQENYTPIYMWDACGLFPELGIKILTSMSLVKVLSDNRLWMHDEVRDFGRKIATGRAIVDFADAGRLWDNEEVLDNLRSNEVNENVQGLRLRFNEFQRVCSFPPKELLNLRFLELRGFPSIVKCALPKLRWLSWHFCPDHVRASDLYLENLVILDLSNSNIINQWVEPGQLEKAKHLKALNLTNCKTITTTPIFSRGMILERLTLEGCEKLVKIDSSVGNLKQLIYLNLKGCCSLQELPKELGSATALTELFMKGDGKSFELQQSLIGLTNLSVLEIYNVKIIDPVHIGNSKRLKHLVLSNCSGIKKLTESGQFFSLLVKLDISGSEITQLPDSIREMTNLKVINMEFSSICELPTSIGYLEKLEELLAKKCRRLRGDIPSVIGALFYLRILDFSFTRISFLPSTLSELYRLQTLNLESCDELENLPELPKSLTCLHVKCRKLKSLPDLSELNSLRDLQLFSALNEFQAGWIWKLSRLVKLELCLPRISALDFGDTSQVRSLSICCNKLETLGQLPSTLLRLCLAHIDELPKLSNLKSLAFIEFYKCSIDHDKFQSLGTEKLKSSEHLSSSECNFSNDGALPLPETLRTVSLRECSLPTSLDLRMLKYLIRLELINCNQLTKISGLEKLESLEEIIICKCSSLQMLGDLSDLQELQTLRIDSCEMLREVKGLQKLKCLKHLQICCCKLLKSFMHRSSFKKRDGELVADLAPEAKTLRSD